MLARLRVKFNETLEQLTIARRVIMLVNVFFMTLVQNLNSAIFAPLKMTYA